MDPNLYAGFSASRGFLPALIRIFSGTFAGGGVNHMFLCWQDPHLGWVTLGANANGVTLIPWAQFTAKRAVIAIFKPHDPALSLRTGLENLKSTINAAYNYPAIVGLGLTEVADFLLRRQHPNRLDLNTNEQFCSEFASRVIRQSGFSFLPALRADLIKPQDALHALARRGDFVQREIPTCGGG